ncbi:lysine--tRNA ligase [Nitratireductor aquimarinus]|uniref:lysine--tRNA ligase n=1 Tax=Nitratireductor TaxID=245876 RepID=UPI0019D3ECA6|nr:MULTISPECIES: lysine--tRNA ligase [Nitratireductor]MBN7775661.1 lysine--tRNA ligase [Nitratireductor pacificus]MBN7781874.1 lysine--tRNA ligase [Nitratireductor pacificus]MBN7790680.1 lysine--tRNA ligase [Nitratireductor aquimarinus]MBY6098408.1 lysine--tRNA ligase [Nitratireductor aquimarinus]MCA1262156.1 lysine--tRNA ligase [Nitratireductor aquimarinus]
MTTASQDALELTPEVIEAAADSKAWPFEEARKIVKRYEGGFPETVLFETGYGPSGLPHIGTFGEVARTSMVRHAFRVLTEDRIKTKILCFSDDMDGLRKVPDNVPNKEMLRTHLGKPLTKVPDPFSNEYPSFGAANNARLRAFLDRFGFDYEFASSTEYYAAGRFDEMLLTMLERYDAVMDIMLPSLREERAQTYSPFLPIHPKTGVVMQVALEERKLDAGSIVWRDPESGELFETPVTGGHCKLQWKPDWAMRWAALDVDYEMSGKDLIDSVKLAAQICAALGKKPPEGFNYELFLDENGQKISKSKGNGLTIDEWLAYAPTESLSLYMFQKPKAAKKLYFDVIPRAVDEYYTFLSAYDRQDWKNRLGNPVWHIHDGTPPEIELPVPFALLLNLVSASNAQNTDVLWGFISRYAPGVTPQTHPELDRLTGYALRYFEDFVKPSKAFRAPDEVEREALADINEALGALPADADGEAIQNAILDVARGIERYQDHKRKSPNGGPGVSVAFFQMLYQVLLGQERGPRFGSFAALYGIAETRGLITAALNDELSA